MSHDNEDTLTRREAIAAGVAAAGLAALPGEADAKGKAEAHGRMPVAFLPHGGGPWPFVDLGMEPSEVDALAGYLRGVRALPRSTPRALLVVSAHWEEAEPTVMTADRPALYFDYYGFPPESYRLTWPAPGHPELARRVRHLLERAGFKTGENAQRGFDHGTFVPLKLTYPEANIPVVQLSLKKGLDPKDHLAMGRALAPLRDEGVFILGSGMTYHNMRGFGDPRARPVSEVFDAWLRETGTAEPKTRDARLVDWTNAPGARQVHPREEHLLPLMVIAGAAGSDRGAVAYSGTMLGVRLSAYHFG